MVIVMMGPAGAGKSTVGTALAERLGWAFVDADEHHPPANVAKMERGVRWTTATGWAGSPRFTRSSPAPIDRRESLVLACSALTARHRALIAATCAPCASST